MRFIRSAAIAMLPDENTNILLAKQTANADEPVIDATLLGHSRQVITSFRLLFGSIDSPTRLTRQWLGFFRLKTQSHLVPFLRNGLGACALHDVGKANSDFQKAIRGGPPMRQCILHDHLGGLLLWLPPVRKWLEDGGLDHLVVTSSIIGHHLRGDSKVVAELRSADRTIFSFDTRGFDELARLLAEELNIEPPGRLAVPEQWSFGLKQNRQDVEPLRTSMRRAWRRARWELAGPTERHRLLMAVRAALVVADSAGSALIREHRDPAEWLQGAFDDESLVNDIFVEESVIRPRVEELRKKTGHFRFTDFQQAAENLSERALLLASCGSGKTLTAWKWIKAQAATRPTARVIFLYPTRATATEGFRDYVSWAPEADAALLHGTSAYELEDMFENPADPGDPRRGRDYTTDDRMFALAYWQRRIFSATVDQFLGFMQHAYRSTCLLPLLTDSVVVIDEVHSFDQSLFSTLKRFLREFHVPVLCMTASLPQHRRADLEQCGLDIFPRKADRFADLQNKADMPRYTVTCLENAESAKLIAEEARNRGRRVLWVVNTVARCQQLARELNAVCYHSRFRLRDRAVRHGEIVSVFQPDGEPVLALTTQVCEMSLDLDAQVLITETAPITSLIQRMGRCNRHASPEKDGGGQGKAYLYPAPASAPYALDDWEGVEEFLQALDGRVVSQTELQRLLDVHGPTLIEVDRYSAFVEGGPWASSREAALRDTAEFTVPAILDNDVDAYRKLRRVRRPTDGLFVPAPRRLTRIDERLGPWPPAAPASCYDTRYGLLDTPVETTP